MGSLKDNPNVQTHGVKINKTCIKTIGVYMYIGHDKELCYQNNWIKCIYDTEKLFESWKTRNLTIFGKCSIINSLAISKLLYLASVLKFPEQKEYQYMNKIIYGFLWKKRDRIKRATLIGKISQGGIGITDIESKFKAIKASWVKKLLTSKTKLKSVIESLCLKYGVDISYVTQTYETKLCDYDIVKHCLCFINKCLYLSMNVKNIQTLLLCQMRPFYLSHYGIIVYLCTKGKHYFSKNGQRVTYYMLKILLMLTV